MQKILTSNAAKRMIDYVSPIYDQSYIGLWLFNVIGIELDELSKFCEELYDQAHIDTATWSLPMWEKEYGITPLEDQTIEQRRERLLQIKKKSAFNPEKLRKLIESMTGVEVEVVENTNKNTFLVRLKGYVDNLDEVKRQINLMKPAHLVYNISGPGIAEEANAIVHFGAAIAQREIITNNVSEVD
jgi:hypothetical protein